MINYNRSTAVDVRSAMVSRVCVRSTSKKWPWIMIPSMPCRNPHRLCIHLDLHMYYVGPQAWCEANLDRLRLFHQWECLKCNSHGLSVSCMKCLWWHPTNNTLLLLLDAWPKTLWILYTWPWLLRKGGGGLPQDDSRWQSTRIVTRSYKGSLQP